MKVDSYEHFFLYSDRNTLDLIEKIIFSSRREKIFPQKGPLGT